MSNFESSFDENDDELFNAYQDSSVDLKFRSIQVQSHTGGDFFPSYHNQHATYGLQHDVHFVKPDITKSSSEAVTNGCPCAPFGIAKTNFKICNSDCVSVVQKVTANLSNHLNYDFTYIDGEFMWKGKYLCGSSSFDLEVNLYHDKATSSYTVAVRKVSCDCSINACFTTFFNLMKTALCTDAAECAKPVRKPFCIPKSCGWSTKVTDEEFLEGVQSIFRMATCSLESRIQSAKMLCDVAQKDAHYLELPAFQPQCVQLLCELVMDETDDVRQHAVMAIAALTELDSYREAFIHSIVLPELFCLVENCQYETAQMRRTAAGILAVFSRTHPYTVRSELQHQHQFDLNTWLYHASCLVDVRTRESALVVKAYLEEVSLGDCPTTTASSGQTEEDDIDTDCLISEEDAAAYLPIIH